MLGHGVEIVCIGSIVGTNARTEAVPTTGGAERRPPLPRAVVAVTALWTAVLLIWSLLLPSFRSTDEIGHVSNGYHLLEVGDWPGYQRLHLLTWVTQALPEEHPGYAPLTTATAEPPAFADLRDATPRSAWSGEVSTTGQHPPGYYLLLAGALALLPEEVPAHTTLWWLRLLNVAMLAPLPLLLAGAARRLHAPPAVIVTASAVPLAIPQVGALGAAVSNDNLMTVSAAALTVLALRAATADLRWRTAALTGAVLAVALFTKAFALVLVPVVVAAYLLGGRRIGDLGAALRRLALVAALAATTGWWWLANLVRHGTVQPAGHQPVRPDGPLDPLGALPNYLMEAVIRVPVRFWAALSIQIGEQPPPFPYALTTGLFLAAAVGALAVLLRHRSFAMGRPEALLLLAPLAGAGAAMVAGTWPLYLRTGLPLGLQGRYLFVGLLGLAVVLALGAAATLPARTRHWTPLAVAGAGGLFTLVSMRKVLGFHWARRDSGLVEGAEALRAWSPVPDAVLVLLALAAAAAAIWAGTEILRQRRIAGEAPGDPAATGR